MHRQTDGTELDSNGMLLTKVAVAAPSRRKEGGAFCRMSLKNILVLRLDDSTRSMRQWAGILQTARPPPGTCSSGLGPLSSCRARVTTRLVILSKTSH